MKLEREKKREAEESDRIEGQTERGEARGQNNWDDTRQIVNSSDLLHVMHLLDQSAVAVNSVDKLS